MPDVHNVLTTPRTNVHDVLTTPRVYDVLATDSCQLQGVEFRWDEEKAHSNVAKHGVTFEEAAAGVPAEPISRL